MSIFSSKALKCLFLAKVFSGHMAFVLLAQGTWEYKEFPEHVPTSFLCLPLVSWSCIVSLLEDWVLPPGWALCHGGSVTAVPGFHSSDHLDRTKQNSLFLFTTIIYKVKVKSSYLEFFSQYRKYDHFPWILKIQLSKDCLFCPDWCGSLGWALFPKLKGCRFDSWSGHIPGLQAARLPVEGVWEVTNGCFSRTSMFLYLSFSLPPSKK